MKKCYVCHSIMDDKASVCSKCKFKIPKIVGNPAKVEAILMQAAAEYRKLHMIGGQIGMVTYSYELVEDELQETGHTDIVLVNDISEANPGDIIWGEQEYARIDAGEEIAVSVFTKAGDTRKDHELTIITPQTDGLWKIGVQVEDGFSFRILIGTAASHAKTASVSMFG